MASHIEGEHLALPKGALVGEKMSTLGANYDPTYVGLNYAPYATDSREHTVKEGKEVTLDNLTVFKKDVRRRKLVQAVYLWDKIDG